MINIISGIDSGDTVFNIVSTMLVFLMIPGLAIFYSGLVRKKNMLNIMACSFVMIGVISILWILFEYSLSFSSDQFYIIGGFDFLGFKGVGAMPNPDYAPTIPHISFAMYQMMFAIITPAIISGAVAERMKFLAFIIFATLWSVFVYTPIAHWVWGTGGWLKELGVLDFAGGNVVHVSAGVAAIVAAIVLGKRRDFGKVPIIPNNIPFVFLGTAILWFGWFGFNGGSALAANGIALNAILVTHISACASMLSWMIIEWVHRGRPTLLGALTGAIVGLSASTAGAGFISPLSACIIGIIASPLSYFIIEEVKARFLYDDALDVFACHGFGGIWGVLMVGLFADKQLNESASNGLFYGNPKQFLVQLLSVVIIALFTAVMTFAILKIMSLFTDLRVNKHEEYDGLDTSLHDEEAYPDSDMFSRRIIIGKDIEK